MVGGTKTPGWSAGLTKNVAAWSSGTCLEMGTTRRADTTTFSCQFPPVSLSTATRRPTPLRSRRGGQFWLVTVLAANREEVCGTDRTGEHAHAHLPRSWLRFGHLADLQDFRGVAEPFK